MHRGTSHTPGPAQPGHSTATAQHQSAPVLQANGSDLLPAPWGTGSPQHGLLHATKPLPGKGTERGVTSEKTAGVLSIPSCPGDPCIALSILNLL